MNVAIVQNASRMPTDGNGASAVQRETGNLTAATASSATCSGGAAAAVAGDIIITSTGHWCEVTGPAVATVVPVKEWKKWNTQPTPTNSGILYPVPSVVGPPTYRIFPASVLQYMQRGVRIKKVNLVGVAGSTLTINGPTSAVLMTIPSTAAAPVVHDYGQGHLVQGPFTVVCSNHAIVGDIEFQPEGS